MSGALQALQLISIGLLRRGATIFLEKPSYLYSLHVFQSVEMRLFGLPLDEHGIQANKISEQKSGKMLHCFIQFRPFIIQQEF